MIVDSRMVRTDASSTGAAPALGRRQLVVGAPHDEPAAVGEHHLLPERLAPRLLGRAARHDERLDGREVDQRRAVGRARVRVAQVDPGGLLDGRVRRPVLRRGHPRGPVRPVVPHRGRGRTDLRGHQHHLAEHAVDEARRIVGGQVLGQLDRLVDGHRFGDVVGVQQFPDRDPQDRPVDGGQPLQRPALQVRGDQVVDVRGVLGHAARHRHRVGVQRRHLGVALRQQARATRRPRQGSARAPRPRTAGRPRACGPDACHGLRDGQAFTRPR